MIKPIAAVLIVALLTVGIVVSTFIASDKEFKFSNTTDIQFGVDHQPPPVVHYHIKKEGVWGL